MLVGAHNGAVDHCIFVVGVCARCRNTRSHAPLLAQRLNRRWTPTGISAAEIEQALRRQPAQECPSAKVVAVPRETWRAMLKAEWATFLSDIRWLANCWPMRKLVHLWN